jgi:hypothetical protein
MTRVLPAIDGPPNLQDVALTLQRWFVAVWVTAVLVVGVFALREFVQEHERQAQQTEWNGFVCQLSPEDC